MVFIGGYGLFCSNTFIAGIHGFVGLFLLILFVIISGKKYKKKVNANMECFKHLQKGMTRDDIIKRLAFKFESYDNVKVYRPYRNGSEVLTYKFKFDTEGKLVDLNISSHKKWTK